MNVKTGRIEKSRKGSATIEAAIILPFFLIVIFSIAYIIKIFYTYNTVQASLSEVARRIGNMSYFYHVSGLKDYADQLDEMARQAGTDLEAQKNAVIDAFSAFNDQITGTGELIDPTAGPGDEPGAGPGADPGADPVGSGELGQLLDILGNQGGNTEEMGEMRELIRQIIEDPKSELKLFMTIFAQRLSYEGFNKIVCLFAGESLEDELGKRVNSAGDPASVLGIEDGVNGLDFNGSSVFGDTESIEFVVNYRVRPPLVFGLVPDFRLSNRVRILAWTGGRGNSVIEENTNEEGTNEGGSDDAESSIWARMDQDKRYWDRGLEIENLETDKLIDEGRRAGREVFTADNYAVMDAYSYDKGTGTAEYYDVFTLNPFMKAYSERPGTIVSQIKKHGKRLLECETPEYLQDIRVKKLKRIVILIVPENSGGDVDQAFEKARGELGKYDIEVRLVRAYGSYPAAKENAEE